LHYRCRKPNASPRENQTCRGVLKARSNTGPTPPPVLTASQPHAEQIHARRTGA
jgi:hypothetical protein